VIHAVGPIWYGGNRREDELLAGCYRRAIELCQASSLGSVAFPAISTGAFRFPAERAAGIALQSTVDMLPSAPALRRVIFCCFSHESARFHEQAMARLSAKGER
jgi:O-acetyl-ADP-ribose deacetylase (regulator of RNase III)